MLKKLYAHNFRCLVNFELSLAPLTLFLGTNGVGKTSVFDVVWRLQRLLSGAARPAELFTTEDLTTWLKKTDQVFNLEVEGNGGTYLYELVIEHDIDREERRVAKERLLFDREPLFEFVAGTVRLYRDDHTAAQEYPFDWSQSGLAAILPRPDNKRLTWFMKRMERIVVAGIQPMAIQAETSRDSKTLSRNMENFASWLQYLLQEHASQVFELTQELRRAMAGFHAFRLRQVGEKRRVLEVGFAEEGAKGNAVYYRFNELSDGQRVQFALYTVLFGLRGLGFSLFLDEPENYLALPDIQPWLVALADECGAGIDQAVLISHHPELINYLGKEDGVWFDRETNSPVRVKYGLSPGDTGLTLAELAARGWIE